jgi:GTP cyclohydrolase I
VQPEEGTSVSVDIERIEKNIREILIAIGEDPDRNGLIQTPRRVAAMYEELFEGFHSDPAEHLKVTFALHGEGSRCLHPR